MLQAIGRQCVIWVWNHTPHCDEMSRLASQSLDGHLPWNTRARMRLHFLVCVWCKRYFQQLRVLHAACERSGQTMDETSTGGLPTAAKERIIGKLREFEPRQPPHI